MQLQGSRKFLNVRLKFQWAPWINKKPRRGNDGG